MSAVDRALCGALAVLALACGDDGGSSDMGMVACIEDIVEGEAACVGATHVRCQDGLPQARDCAAEGLVCDDALGCVSCTPGVSSCLGAHVSRCAADGTWTVEVCDLDVGQGCRDGECTDLCALAAEEPGTRGCEFHAADLDRLESEDRLGSPASWGIVVANPWPAAVRVTVERNTAPFGSEPAPTTILSALVPPGDIAALELPPAPVDGSADGAAATHSAVTSQGHRIRTSLPVSVLQLGPLTGTDDSSDASLLLATPALGTDHTVVGWSQTLADGDTPETDFDPTRDDEDSRAFLTIVGTEADTHVVITAGSIGPEGTAIQAGGSIPELGPGEAFTIDIGPFDVVNLETRGLGSSFAGATVEASHPVAVFSGSEASDAPLFESYAERQCCADHLQEQLWPDSWAGDRFVVGAEPPRLEAVSRALEEGGPMASYRAPFWVRVVGADDTRAEVTTSLPGPEAGPYRLDRGEDVILRAEQSFELEAAGGRVHVAQVLPGGAAAGALGELPGGDPSMVLVAPVARHRSEHLAVVPPGHPFDFVSVVARRATHVRLDGVPVEELLGEDGRPACGGGEVPTAIGDGFDGDWVVHHCQLSFPVVEAPPSTVIQDGSQGDGLHVVSADAPVAVTISGFGSYAGYAHPGEVEAPRSSR